jgi:hypothetical protein
MSRIRANMDILTHINREQNQKLERWLVGAVLPPDLQRVVYIPNIPLDT